MALHRYRHLVHFLFLSCIASTPQWCLFVRCTGDRMPGKQMDESSLFPFVLVRVWKFLHTPEKYYQLFFYPPTSMVASTADVSSSSSENGALNGTAFLLLAIFVAALNVDTLDRRRKVVGPAAFTASPYRHNRSRRWRAGGGRNVGCVIHEPDWNLKSR